MDAKVGLAGGEQRGGVEFGAAQAGGDGDLQGRRAEGGQAAVAFAGAKGDFDLETVAVAAAGSKTVAWLARTVALRCSSAPAGSESAAPLSKSVPTSCHDGAAAETCSFIVCGVGVGLRTHHAISTSTPTLASAAAFR
ncbi:MAG: hypothetical protein RIT45_2551 [Pseudomonadota bacterium]